MDIENKIREIVCQQLDAAPEQVLRNTLFVDDLGADSLTVMELVLALEEEFEIDIPENDIEEMRTFGDVVAFIAAKDHVFA